MLGGSPIKVAVPCRLLETAIAIIMFTGLILSLLAKDNAIGATIKTVATFSTKAEIMPVKRQIKSTAHAVFLALSTMISAIYVGTRLLIKISATKSVPTKIPITFQLIAFKASLGETASNNKRSKATTTDINVLFLSKKQKVYKLKQR